MGVRPQSRVKRLLKKNLEEFLVTDIERLEEKNRPQRKKARVRGVGLDNLIKSAGQENCGPIDRW